MPNGGGGLYSSIRSSVAAFTRLYQVTAVVTGLFIPVIVGVLCTYYPDLVKINPLLFWGSIVTVVTISIAYTLASIGIKSAPETMLDVIAMEQKIAGLESTVGHLATVEMLCRTWRAAVDEYIRNGITSREELIADMGVLCQILVNSKDDLFHFDRRELWNFAVYLYDENSQELRAVWRERHSSHPSGGMGRSWKSGQGHVGITYSNAQTRITADATAPEVAGLLRAPADRLQRYDDQTYVSLHAEPILAVSGPPHGVIVATSDRAGRFEIANSLALSHLAAELSSLLMLGYRTPN